MAKAQKPPDPVNPIVAALESWKPAPPELDHLLACSSRSLEEVTHLTEYQDDKANRILTAMAFLSAFAAALFATLLQQYPPGSPARFLAADRPFDAYWLTCISYIFAIYVTLLVLGASFVVWALRPRFNLPKSWSANPTTTPKSFLFFTKVLESGPANWANAFVQMTPDQLRLEYTKNSILETYLISEKIRQKLRFLQPGVTMLWLSTPFLALWLLLSLFALASFPPVPSPSQDPSSISVPVEHAPRQPRATNPPLDTPNSSGTPGAAAQK
jgi:hypothetical protein